MVGPCSTATVAWAGWQAFDVDLVNRRVVTIVSSRDGWLSGDTTRFPIATVAVQQGRVTVRHREAVCDAASPAGSIITIGATTRVSIGKGARLLLRGMAFKPGSGELLFVLTRRPWSVLAQQGALEAAQLNAGEICLPADTPLADDGEAI